jgi:hypothetical protein
MIELVVAIFIGVAVISAAAAIFANANDSSLASQRQYSLVSALQQQIENVHELVDQHGFGVLAMTGSVTAGTASGDPTDPRAYVSGTGCTQTFAVKANYNGGTETYASGGLSTDPTEIADGPETLVENGCQIPGASSGTPFSGGQISPAPQYFDISTGVTSTTAPTSDPYAALYTFVTETTQAGCGQTAANACQADVRRVVVAAVLSAGGTDFGTNYPTYSTTIFANGAASDQTNSASGLRILGLIS